MAQMKTQMKFGKAGAAQVTFSHDDQFVGDVEIRKGAVCLTIGFDALCALVAERVRYRAIESLQSMKHDDLLKAL